MIYKTILDILTTRKKEFYHDGIWTRANSTQAIHDNR